MNRHRVQPVPACQLANLISFIGSTYLASAKSGDDSIYNMSRRTMKKKSLLFSQEEKVKFIFSLSFLQGEKKFSLSFLQGEHIFY